MALKRILITVTTYPLPSRSYDELVCTAGVLEDGTWIRIYPIPLSWLNQVKKDTGFKKYTWVEIDLKKSKSSDFRPESYSPINYKITIHNTLNTKFNWAERKKYCLKKNIKSNSKYKNES